jgi:transmembrane sensor
VVASRGAFARTSASDAVTQAVAWRERRLVFRGDTLLEVAREFDRYNERPIVIEDESIGGRQLTGVFDADDPESLVLFLAKDPGMALKVRSDVVVVTAAAPGEGPGM